MRQWFSPIALVLFTCLTMVTASCTSKEEPEVEFELPTDGATLAVLVPKDEAVYIAEGEREAVAEHLGVLDPDAEVWAVRDASFDIEGLAVPVGGLNVVAQMATDAEINQKLDEALEEAFAGETLSQITPPIVFSKGWKCGKLIRPKRSRDCVRLTGRRWLKIRRIEYETCERRRRETCPWVAAPVELHTVHSRSDCSDAGRNPTWRKVRAVCF